MIGSRSHSLFLAALAVGIVIRAAALPLPGTNDVIVWKIWGYVASHDGVGTMYGVGGSPPERRLLSFRGVETTVDYPPLALYELGLAGRVFRWVSRGRYPNNGALVVAMKLPAVLGDAGLAVLLWIVVGRIADDRAARWATVAYWLNPAIAIDASVLGYLDPLFVLPAVGSLVAASFGSPLAAGGLAMAAAATKPQAIIVAPALALAISNLGGRARAIPRTAAFVAGAGLVGALVAAPVIRAGGWTNMIQAFDRLRYHNMLSGNACNLWWIVGYAVRVQYSSGEMGVWAAITAPTKILQISRFMEVGYPNPRVIGTLLAGAAMAWGVWTARRQRTLWMMSALGAFLVHAYATLAAQVHENHLYAAIPLLVLAAAGRRRFAPVLLTLSAIFTLNLNLFYGISENVGYALPRTLTVVDATVLLAVANCAALLWHATVFKGECSASAEWQDCRESRPGLPKSAAIES